jgi:hypothetical protein
MNLEILKRVIGNLLREGRTNEQIKAIPIIKSNLSDLEIDETINSIQTNVPIVIEPKEQEPEEELDEEIPIKKYPSLTFRVTPHLKVSLKEFCRLTNNKPSWILQQALEEYLMNHKNSLHPAVRNLIE